MLQKACSQSRRDFEIADLRHMGILGVQQRGKLRIAVSIEQEIGDRGGVQNKDGQGSTAVRGLGG